MTAARRLIVLLAVGALVSQATIWGQTDPPSAPAQSPQVVARRIAAASRVAARGTTTIFGYVWNADNTPIPNAALRLRNVVSGRVEMTATSNESGEFTFSDIEGGTYVIEYIDERGKVLAVGHTFSVAPGETVATFVRLGTRLGWFSGLFGNAAAAAVASAAGLGVTAVSPTGQDISPIVP